MNRRTTLGISALAISAMALAACSSGPDEGPIDSTDPDDYSTDSISMALSTDPATFDPALGRSIDDYTTARMLFDTLLRKDDDNELVGGVAESYEAIDASNYTFTIRDDAFCADGTLITASIVAESLQRFTDESTQRSLALGSASAQVTADDSTSTVSVVLSEPWSDFPIGVTLPHAGIVCPAGLADLEGLAAGTVEGAFSGPYTLASAQAAVSYELALREDYDGWPEFATPLEGVPAATVTLIPVGDPATIATQLIAGGLDVAALTGESVNRLEDDPSFTLVDVANITTYLIFNQRPGTVFADNPDLRLAVAQAVDAEGVRDVMTDGRGDVLLSVTSANARCANTDTSLLPAYDPTAASAELEGASIHFVGTQLLGTGNEYVAELLRNAGADINFEALDNANWSTVTTTDGGANWDLTVQGDINLAGTLVSSLLRVMGPSTEDGGRNKMGLVNEEGYEAIQLAMSLTDPTEQCAALQTAQESFLNNVDAFPLTSSPQTLVTTDGFSIRTFGDYIDSATLRITR